MSIGLFDILGPVTVGPSSSHTAGAVRIGYACRILLAEEIVSAKITFYGSFAETYSGHGTDKAIVGGLLGLSPADTEVRNSLQTAVEKGVKIEFETADEPRFHPNTAVVEAHSKNKSIHMRACSLGGGAIKINTLNNFKIETPCNQDTLVIIHKDVSGILAAITTIMAWDGYNISNMTLARTKKAGDVVTLIETDVPVLTKTVDMLRNTKDVVEIIIIPKF